LSPHRNGKVTPNQIFIVLKLETLFTNNLLGKVFWLLLKQKADEFYISSGLWQRGGKRQQLPLKVKHFGIEILNEVPKLTEQISINASNAARYDKRKIQKEWKVFPI